MQRRERGLPVELDSCVVLAANAMHWRIEQAQAFREQVEHFTDARAGDPGRRLPGAAALRALPHPSCPLVIHRFRDPRAEDADALVLPTVVVGDQALSDTIVGQGVDLIHRG
jgi:hypothetical protein